MSPDSRVFIAGPRGMVGSAVVRALQREGFRHLLVPSRSDLDLCDGAAVERFFAREKPEVVVLAAARVGGIHANNTYPAEFLHENLALETNIIHQAWRHGTARLLFLGSSCIYPRDAAQPMTEECLLSGPLEKTNEAYAIAKIAGVKMCEFYRRQYGALFHSAMPTNLYGPGDNYHPENSHVLPALIRRFHEAREAGTPAVTAWGTGSPRREFLHVDDLADALLFLLRDPAPPDLINVGCGSDVTIRELTGLVAAATSYQGEIVWDTSKPDGTPRKLMDSSKIFARGWRPRIDLAAGIADAYADFLARRADGSARL